MDWKKYEEITKHIYETLGKASGVRVECFGNQCKIKGKSFVEHQVDVLTSHSDGIHSYKTVIECKYWEENINKDIIMKVAEIVEDTGASKGIIVSKNGFTPDAVAFAKYKNIGLVELREPTDDDWEGRIRTIQFNMNMLLPQVNGIELIISPETISTLKQGSRMRVEFLDFEYPDGKTENIEKYIKDFTDEVCKKEENEPFEKVYEFEEGTVAIYAPTKEKTIVKGIKISGLLKIAKETF